MEKMIGYLMMRPVMILHQVVLQPITNMTAHQVALHPITNMTATVRDAVQMVVKLNLVHWRTVSAVCLLTKTHLKPAIATDMTTMIL